MKDRWYCKYGRYKHYFAVETCAHAQVLLEKTERDLEKLDWWKFRKRFILKKEIEWLTKRLQLTQIPSD